MPTTSLRWVAGGRQFVGSDSNHHSVVLSGEDPATGVRPSEMLLIALSACSAYDVVDIMEKKRRPLSYLEVIADGQRDENAPWPYRRIHLTYRLKGKDLTDKAVSQAITLSEQKYCSVAATVRGVAEISTSYEILS